MFKKKDVKKPKDISENNNSSSDEELSDDELFNVSGGAWKDLSAEERKRFVDRCGDFSKSFAENLKKFC